MVSAVLEENCPEKPAWLQAMLEGKGGEGGEELSSGDSPRV